MKIKINLNIKQFWRPLLKIWAVYLNKNKPSKNLIPDGFQLLVSIVFEFFKYFYKNFGHGQICSRTIF